MRKIQITTLFTLFIALFMACEDKNQIEVHDPDNAEKVSIDRFAEPFANLFMRNAENNFPGANEAVNFDEAPFITQGLGPGGEKVKYYNFDVLPIKSAPIYVLFKKDANSPVDGQLNIINVIPGDDGYNDFWNVHIVTVPDDYTANAIASVSDLMAAGYEIEQTTILVNCPVVPEGSTAMLRYGTSEPKGLIRGWYKNKVVFYFSFEEKDLSADIPTSGYPNVPLSDIVVTFNINPDQPGGGPASGFVTETGSMQTHNVTETIPTDADYSPLWDVDVYDNMDFANVSNWNTVTAANILATGVAIVNCPIVYVE